MPKLSKAILQMPPATSNALQRLGADLTVARLRRRESLKTWAKRLGITIPTLLRLEAGDPSVSVGIVATALWLIGRDSELTRLAAPEHDKGALELSVKEAMALAEDRARSSAEAAVSSKARQAQ